MDVTCLDSFCPVWREEGNLAWPGLGLRFFTLKFQNYGRYSFFSSPNTIVFQLLTCILLVTENSLPTKTASLQGKLGLLSYTNIHLLVPDSLCETREKISPQTTFGASQRFEGSHRAPFCVFFSLHITASWSFKYFSITSSFHPLSKMYLELFSPRSEGLSKLLLVTKTSISVTTGESHSWSCL